MQNMCSRLLMCIALEVLCFSSGLAAPFLPVIVPRELIDLAAKAQVTMGVFAVNMRTHRVLAYHAKARFPLCSTSKVMGVAAVLKYGEMHPGYFNRRIQYQQDEVLAWSPVTSQQVHSGMTVSDLAKAAITMSDNTAFNVLIKQVAGPKGVTAFARAIGDDAFSLTDFEPDLNLAQLGDLQNTSTPQAMAVSLSKLVLGRVLSPKSRALLSTWLIENTTGGDRIRAAVPTQWLVGDKTGTCNDGIMNDMAVIWPRNQRPIVLVIDVVSQAKQGKISPLLIAQAAAIVLPAISR